MTITQCLFALMAISLVCGQLSARGGYHSEDRYNPQHISSLPPEVRNSVLHKCSTPKALHTFAIYFDNLKGVVLHFEHFLCDGDDPYWLLRSYYAPASD
jgi:hypothetical protein